MRLHASVGVRPYASVRLYASVGLRPYASVCVRQFASVYASHMLDALKFNVLTNFSDNVVLQLLVSLMMHQPMLVQC